MRRSECGTRNRHQIIFRKIWSIYIENVDKNMIFFVTLIKLRLDFLFTDLSKHFGIYFVVFAFTSFSFIGVGVRSNFVKTSSVS